MSWPVSICVVGGGTAGWLAAMMLSDSAARAKRPCAITVVDSSKIGTIGVGEGTTAVFRQMLRHFGLDERAFLAETGATIKYGIRHRDWRRLGHSYDGPIDDPHQVAGLAGQGPHLDAYAVAHDRPVAEVHLFQHLLTRGRAPYADRNGRLVPAGPFHHAYHFDQALAGAFLRRHARGVERIDAEVTEVLRDGESGDISALRLDDGRELTAELYVDATGFRRRLIGEMGSTWLSFADVLPVNRAMPFWVDLAPGEEIEPATLAWAQGAGWLWRIPTQGRYGCGYVYSDAHTTPEAAQAEIESALGHPIEPRRDICFDAGRLDEVWRGNCVAVGLSSSFLEPLEATSIHGTVVQLMLLISFIGRPDARQTYNRAVARQVDDFRDFIRLHYVSERRDTPFWRDIAETHPDDVKSRLALWRTKFPGPEDFAPFPGNLPHVGHHLHIPVLDGLGLLDRGTARASLAARPKVRAHARKTHARLLSEYRRAAGQCLGHRAFLEGLASEKAA